MRTSRGHEEAEPANPGRRTEHEQRKIKLQN
jgi:hypothetical protein